MEKAIQGEGQLFLPLGSVERILLLPIIKWMCFACMIFDKNCLNKCNFCIKCKTKLHISFVAFAALF